MYYLLKCRSLTYAQRSARLLERAGITGTVTRLPRSVGFTGCGYSVIVSAKNLKRSLEVLERNDLRPEKIYCRNEKGEIREARHDLS